MRIENLISEIKKDKELFFRYLLFTLLAIICSYSGVKMLIAYVQTIIDPNPQGYREGAMIVTTNLLMEGKNPYSMENMPLATNVYGIFYNLIVFPFAKLFGSDLFVHRLISGISIILCGFVFYMALIKTGVKKYYGFAAVITLYAALLVSDSALTKPCSLGEFLFLSCIYLPFIYNYSRKSLAISIFLGILAFYTKPYFFLAPIYVGMYLFLFKSKKKGIIYASILTVLFLLSVVWINSIFETYFLNTFFIHKTVEVSSLEYLYQQFVIFNKINLALYIVFLIILIEIAVRNGGIIKNYFTTFRFSKAVFAKINFSEFSSPLIQTNFSISFFALIFSFLIVYFIMGRHTGNWMVYFFELLTPFLLISILSLASQQRSRSYFIYLPLLIITMYAQYLYSPHIYRPFKDWDKINSLISRHTNILNTPAIAPLILRANKKLYDSGQTEYFQYATYSDKNIPEGIFPSNKIISEKYNNYKADIYTQVRNRKFDLIILSDFYPIVPRDTVNKYYKNSDYIRVIMSHTMDWNLYIWEKK